MASRSFSTPSGRIALVFCIVAGQSSCARGQACNTLPQCKQGAGSQWEGLNKPPGGRHTRYVPPRQVRSANGALVPLPRTASNMPELIWRHYFDEERVRDEETYVNLMWNFFLKEEHFFSVVNTMPQPPPRNSKVQNLAGNTRLIRLTSQDECQFLKRYGFQPRAASWPAVVGAENVCKWFSRNEAAARSAATNAQCTITCEVAQLVQILQYELGTNDQHTNIMFRTKNNEETNVCISYVAFGRSVRGVSAQRWQRDGIVRNCRFRVGNAEL